MNSPHTRRLLASLALLLAACGSIPERNPVPRDLVDLAQIPGQPRARFWGDEPPPWFDQVAALADERLAIDFAGVTDCEHHYLAVSGGGENGAFGAGLLAGWSEAGTRPEFTIVTGISTGALIAPFAFLGPRHDPALKEIYTTYRTEDLIEERGVLAALGSDAFFDAAPLRKKIGQYVSDAVLTEIAAEHRRGRRLYVGTTNLDAARPVIWDIGAMVQGGRPEQFELVRDVLLASASIPGAFPPVHIKVEAGGVAYDEIHVDGGTTSQVFLLPLGIDWSAVTARLRTRGVPRAYVLRNAALAPRWEAVDPAGLGVIVGRSISSLIRTQGIGDMHRIYLGAMRDGLDYNLATIPDDFDEVSPEFFDPGYMGRLYEVGRGLGRSGEAWRKQPPGVIETSADGG
jgi:hypothetical protein